MLAKQGFAKLVFSKCRLNYSFTKNNHFREILIYAFIGKYSILKQTFGNKLDSRAKKQARHAQSRIQQKSERFKRHKSEISFPNVAPMFYTQHFAKIIEHSFMHLSLCKIT